MNRREIGGRCEREAAALLRKRGYEILAFNYRCPYGEIDVIARHRGVLVFTEVKYRSGGRMGGALEAVGPKKQEHLRAAALCYLQEKGLPLDTPCRFDVIGREAGQWLLVEDAF